MSFFQVIHRTALAAALVSVLSLSELALCKLSISPTPGSPG